MEIQRLMRLLQRASATVAIVFLVLLGGSLSTSATTSVSDSSRGVSPGITLADDDDEDDDGNPVLIGAILVVGGGFAMWLLRKFAKRGVDRSFKERRPARNDDDYPQNY